jgi:hypothetical protein
MRFIDNKGRLFGIINVIDLSVLVLITALVLSFAVNMIKYRSDTKATKKNIENNMSVEYFDTTIMFREVPKQVLKDPKVLVEGDVFFGGNAAFVKVLEVVDLPYKDRGADYCTVTILLRIKCVNLLGEYYCNNFPIKINCPLTIANSYYTLYGGVILNMKAIENA